MRQASESDALKILQLYFDVYQGNYTDARMTDFVTLKKSLDSTEYLWMIEEENDQIVGSVVYQIDLINRLAKAFGAVVRPQFRGRHLTEELMSRGMEIMTQNDPSIQVVYATTRTVSAAPQKLTQNLGYKKLGIFPNIHQTSEPETHTLTAYYAKDAFKSRYHDFLLHPKLEPLYDIVKHECDLAPLKIASEVNPIPALPKGTPRIAFEVIDAPNFVRYQFLNDQAHVRHHHWFFPFNEPNLILTTSDASLQVFVSFSHVDRYCAIIAIRDEKNVGYYHILESACFALRKLGVRYLEFIMRADEVNKISIALETRFIPCAYFPAMQLSASGYRFDYVVFSRSFEILDFKGLKFEGVYKDYLKQYFAFWEEAAYESVFDE